MSGSISKFQVQFDQPINPATFTTADVAFTRILGANETSVAVNSVTVVPGTNNTLFNVDIADQGQAANYRVTIGPMITGANGLPMDQNADLSDSNTPHTQYYDMGARLMFSRAASPSSGGAVFPIENVWWGLGPINVPGSSITSSEIADVNLLLTAFHGFPSRHLALRVTSPGETTIVPLADNSSNVAGDAPDWNLGDIDSDGADELASTTNGFLDTLLDDQSINAQITATINPNAYHYTDSYTPRVTPLPDPLNTFNGQSMNGNWIIEMRDFASDNHLLMIHDYSLIFTPAISAPDIRINSVTNVDGDRDLVEVNYSVIGAGGAGPTVTFRVYESRDPSFDRASDTPWGAFTASGAQGTRTVKVPASLFPNPPVSLNHELFALVVADPDYRVLDPNRSNNIGVLTGVTQTSNGTLWVAGDPQAPDNITITNSQVTFANLNGGAPISFTPGAIQNMFVGTGGGDDAVNASAVANWRIIAMMGKGDDVYQGGSQIDAVQGGSGDDHLAGNDGADRLFGMDGNDTVDGGAGDDLVGVDQGAGLQLLSPGAGSDAILIVGTQFSDEITVWDPDANLGAVGPSLEARSASPASPPLGVAQTETLNLTLTGVEPIDRLIVGAGSGDDLIRLQSLSVPSSRVGLNALVGAGPGNDEIHDGLGADTLYGDQYNAPRDGAGDGNDIINSLDGSNHDVVYGAGGANACTPGEGDWLFDCS
jgi:Ca2+-binding RTX toxin-like protein